MEVEEDPSSQFVDFTNATALEQFIADLEQTLIAWQLANKGHASLEALTAAFPQPGDPQSPRTTYTHPLDPSALSTQYGSNMSLSNEPAVWSTVLELDPPADKPSANPTAYALTLFVSRQHHEHASPPENADADGASANTPLPSPPVSSSGNRTSAMKIKKKKQWQEGLEHFTPTMLSVADAKRDFQWHDSRMASSQDGSGAYSSNTTVTEDDDLLFTKKSTFRNVQKWFGVDEFLFLSRTVQGVTKKPPTSNSRTKRPNPTPPSSSSGNFPEGDVDKVSTALTQKMNLETPASNSEDDEALDILYDFGVDQNESGMLLSALNIALSNCSCTMPAFVPVFEPSHGTWLGSALPGATGNVSIAFETDSVPELNPNQNCISGLLDFFKLKLQLPPHIEERCRLARGETDELAEGMLVSASFAYKWRREEDPREAEKLLEKQLDDKNAQASTDHQPHNLNREIAKRVFGEGKHYVGSTTSPLLGMDLKVIWSNLREGTYVDNVVHSTLDPYTAPEWMLEVQFQDLTSSNERKPQLPLSKLLSNLVQAYSNSKELSKDILVAELAPGMGNPPSGSSTPPLSSSGSSSRFSESIPAARAAVVLGNAIGTITSSLVSAAWKGTDVEEIRRIAAELFDDLEDADESESRAKNSNGQQLSQLPSRVVHSAPIGQLVSILACRMGQLHGINGMALLWVEFVKGLRDRWYLQRLLPYMSTATEGDGSDSPSTQPLSTWFLMDSNSFQLPPPDFHQCLLYQKLQLLNCCILRHAQLSRSPPSASPDADSSQYNKTKMSDLTSFTVTDDDVDEDVGAASDDEFFDSVEHHENSGPPLTPSKPEGIYRVIEGMYCLQTNAPLMEPVTQVGVPMTEDEAKQQQDLLSRLGVSVESAMLRQQLQSSALVSDMQAFKAANPGACLADFIRWYSPKDWIPFESLNDQHLEETLPKEGKDVWWFENHGMLSDRMRFGSPNQHVWQHMWETSSPISADRQRRLFDPAQESEKIYHYLETMSPHEMLHQMLAGAIASCVFALETALPFSINEVPVLEMAMQDLLMYCNRAIELLDEALAESQVAFPAGRDHKEEQERAKGQLQIAFEMALDACWKLVRGVEVVENLISNTKGLLEYFPIEEDELLTTREQNLALINFLLIQSNYTISKHRELRSIWSDASRSYTGEISNLLRETSLRQRVAALILENPVVSGPVQREYILRCICPRPFLREYYGDDPSTGGELEEEDDVNGKLGAEQCLPSIRDMEESPLVVNRMYAAFKKNTVRFALVLAESEF